MEVLFQGEDRLPLGDFIVELKRYQLIFDALGNPGKRAMHYMQLASDLIRQVRVSNAPILAKELGLVDEDGVYRAETVTFARHMIDHTNPDILGLVEPLDAILNWDEIKPVFLHVIAEGVELAMENYEAPMEVAQICVAYGAGNWGLTGLLVKIARHERWMTAQEVEAWMKFPVSDATPELAASIYGGLKNRFFPDKV